VTPSRVSLAIHHALKPPPTDQHRRRSLYGFLPPIMLAVQLIPLRLYSQLWTLGLTPFPCESYKSSASFPSFFVVFLSFFPPAGPTFTSASRVTATLHSRFFIAWCRPRRPPPCRGFRIVVSLLRNPLSRDHLPVLQPFLSARASARMFKVSAPAHRLSLINP